MVQSRSGGSYIRDFTSGNVVRQLILFSAPLFFSNLLQVIYNMVDMLVIGRTSGSIGLSAISVGGDVTALMTFVAMGFSNAGQVIISQLIGADQKQKISKFVGTMFSFLMLCSIAIMVFVLIFRIPILRAMNTPEEAFPYALDYITICSLGLLAIYGYNTACAILRGLGDSRHPFVFISAAALTNIGLDLLFVTGFGWGAKGAALATVISQLLSFVLAAFFLYKNAEALCLDFSRESFRIRNDFLMLLIKLGLPMAIKSAAVQFSKLFVNSWVNSYGVAVSAVSGVGNKLNTIANLFSNSINTAGSSMVGQNIGAEKYKRVSGIMKYTFLIVISIDAVLCVLLAVFPEQIFRLFTSESGIMEVAGKYVPIGVLVFLGSAFRAPMNTLLNGSGNYKMNFAVALLDGMINRIGFSVLFGIILHMEYVGFWLGDALASFTPFLIGGVYYLSGKWKTRKYIIKDD